MLTFPYSKNWQNNKMNEKRSQEYQSMDPEFSVPTTSLIYADKFEFEYSAIMEDKQCKQTERFSVMAKGSNYFLLLDDKSKLRYEVKINM